MEMSTVTMSKKIKKRLDALKIHPRQSYEEVIEGLLDKEE